MNMVLNETLWNHILNDFKILKNISNQAYSTFLARTEFISADDKNIIIRVHGEFIQEYIYDYYHSDLEKFISERLQNNYRLIIETENNQNINSNTKKTLYNDTNYIETNLDPEFNFSNFVVGPNNQYAHAAALSSATNPSKKNNPLFIYGDTGLGKTHLLNAIGNLALEKRRHLKIYYIRAEKFLNEMIKSIATEKMDSFRLKFRKIDLLLIDDIHLLAGKVHVQEEFFNTFNELYSAKKQIIMTSDKPPKEMQNLEERLKSRFEWGLLVDITSPQYETKMAIMLKKLEGVETKFEISTKILNYIAGLNITNIRQLEGCLNKIINYMEFTNEPITLEKTMELLKDIVRDTDNKIITIRDIVDLVTKTFTGITEDDLKSPTRTKHLTQARHIIMYLARQVTNLKTEEIGEYFNRDHATVTHATKTINQKTKQDKNFYNIINDFVEKLTK